MAHRGSEEHVARRRRDAEHSRNMILDAVERLMAREGYAAVNTRTVAIEAGIKPPLVHYHFDTTENLLLEAYRRTAARSEASLRDVIVSDQPLRSLWRYNSDPVRTALATQFLALANQRKSLGKAMAANVERYRLVQAEAIDQAVKGKRFNIPGFTPESVAMLIGAVGRAFVMESTIEVTTGHDDLRRLVEYFIDYLEPPVDYHSSRQRAVST